MNRFEDRWRSLARRAAEADEPPLPPPPALGPLLDALARPARAPTPRWQLVLAGVLALVVYAAIAPLAPHALDQLRTPPQLDLGAIPKPPRVAPPELPAPPRPPSLAALTQRVFPTATEETP